MMDRREFGVRKRTRKAQGPKFRYLTVSALKPGEAVRPWLIAANITDRALLRQAVEQLAALVLRS